MFPRWLRANVTWLLNKLPHLINVLYLMWKAQEGGLRGPVPALRFFLGDIRAGSLSSGIAFFFRNCPKFWDAVGKGSGDDVFPEVWSPKSATQLRFGSEHIVACCETLTKTWVFCYIKFLFIAVAPGKTWQAHGDKRMDLIFWSALKKQLKKKKRNQRITEWFVLENKQGHLPLEVDPSLIQPGPEFFHLLNIFRFFFLTFCHCCINTSSKI